MSEFRVGGAYVDLYIKGLENYNKNLDASTKKLVEYTTKIIDLKKEQERLKLEISKTSDKTLLKSLKSQLKDVEKEIKNTKDAYKITNDEIKQQIKLVSDLGNAVKKDLRVQKNTKDIQKNFENLGKSAQKTVGHFNNLALSGSILRGVLTALSAQKLYDFLIEPNAQLEQHLVQFNTLLGSMENAQRMMNDIIRIAKITPFETNDVVEAIEILSQYGEAQQDLIPTFNKLADLSRGNADNLNNIALAYGRIKNSGKVTLRELNIMIRRGVPVMQAFAESTGKSTAEIYKMIRAGELGVDVFENAIDYLATNGGRFEGLVAEQGKTLKGRISTLKDDLTFIGKDIGEAAFKELSGYINDIIAEIERLEATGELKEFTESLGQGIGDAVKRFIEFSKTLYSFKEDIAAATSYLLSFIVALKTLDKVDTGLKAITETFTKFKSGNVVIMGLAAALSFATTEIAKINAESLKFNAQTRSLIDDNQKLTESYDKQLETIEANANKAGRLTAELESLMKVTKKSEKEHKNIRDVITELNNIYPELNLRYDEEREELNRTIPVIENYIRAKKGMSEKDIKENYIDDLKRKNVELETERKLIEKQIDELTAEYNRIQEQNKDKIKDSAISAAIFNTVPIIGQLEYIYLTSIPNTYKALDDEARVAANTLNDLSVKIWNLRESWTGLTEEIDENNEKIGVNEEEVKSIIITQQDLNEILKQQIITYQSLKEELDNVGSSIHQTFTDLEDDSSALREEIDGAIDSVDELTEAIITNGEEEGFNADAARELISTYPELKDAIYQTAEGYKFEEEALISLKEEKIQAAKDAITSRIQELQTLLDATKKSIEAYEAEGKALLNLKILKSSIDRAEGKSGVGSFKDYYYGNKEERASDLQKQAEEYQKLINELKNELDSYDTQLNIASSTFGRDIGKKKSSKDTETADELAIRNLKFQYDMGIIDAKNYYDSLEKIKNKYYAEGSKKWQQYTLEIKQGREKVDEEARKLAEDEFKTTYESMKNQLDDEEHFDNLSKEEKVERLKEIRRYIKDSYDKRLIDYETYKEEYRQISRDIYSTEKDVLKDSIDELNELRDKKYKAAVEQIEKYYEDIDKAQEAAEREQELKELRQTEQLYEGAVSRAGQEKLKELQKDIKELEKEKMQDELEAQREYHLENLDAKYKALEESQNEYFETVQGGIKTTAQIVGEYTSQIAGFFSQINEILNTARGESVQTSNNLTINQNIYDASSNRAAIDMSQIVSSYGFK